MKSKPSPPLRHFPYFTKFWMENCQLEELKSAIDISKYLKVLWLDYQHSATMTFLIVKKKFVHSSFAIRFHVLSFCFINPFIPIQSPYHARMLDETETLISFQFPIVLWKPNNETEWMEILKFCTTMELKVGSLEIRVSQTDWERLGCRIQCRHKKQFRGYTFAFVICRWFPWYTSYISPQLQIIIHS